MAPNMPEIVVHQRHGWIHGCSLKPTLWKREPDEI